MVAATSSGSASSGSSASACSYSSLPPFKERLLIAFIVQKRLSASASASACFVIMLR